MKKVILTLLLSLIVLSGCSDLPPRLKKTASQEMLTFMAQNSSITEDNLYLEPLLTDQLQVNEDQWCLTYEIGHLISFSTLWEKQDRDWGRTDIKPYTENCNWAR